MNKSIYFALHFVLVAVMAVTAVTMSLKETKETNLPEEPAEVETTAFVVVETEADDIQELDIFENETPETEEPTTISLGEFKLTAYCGENYPHICNDGDSTHTATMTHPTAERTIAVDPKVIPYGSKVLINGITYIAEDCGGAIQGNRIDVFCDTHAEALEFGIQYADVTIIK